MNGIMHQENLSFPSPPYLHKSAFTPAPYGNNGNNLLQIANNHNRNINTAMPSLMPINHHQQKSPPPPFLTCITPPMTYGGERFSPRRSSAEDTQERYIGRGEMREHYNGSYEDMREQHLRYIGTSSKVALSPRPSPPIIGRHAPLTPPLSNPPATMVQLQLPDGRCGGVVANGVDQQMAAAAANKMDIDTHDREDCGDHNNSDGSGDHPLDLSMTSAAPRRSTPMHHSGGGRTDSHTQLTGMPRLFFKAK